jgi:hypothetical protein
MTRQVQPNPIPGPAATPASKRQAQGELEVSPRAVAARGSVQSLEEI